MSFYIYSNTKHIVSDIVHPLSHMLYEHNPHAKSFQMAKQWLFNSDTQHLKLCLISDRKTYGRIYNVPTVSEVAALVVGDLDMVEQMDIIMQTKG